MFRNVRGAALESPQTTAPEPPLTVDSRRLLDRDCACHRCSVNGAVIVIDSGGGEGPVERSLILGRRSRAVVEGDAVRHAGLTAVVVRIVAARIPRPLHRCSDGNGLGARTELVVNDRNAAGRRRCVAGWWIVVLWRGAPI